MKKKKILAIILVIFVVVLGGASVYVATQLSTKQTVAPNAPASKPKASEPCGNGLYCANNNITGSTACANSAGVEMFCCPLGQTIVNGACTGTIFVGSNECTVSGVATATESGLTYLKESFRNDPTNTAGVYKHTDANKISGPTAKVVPGETIVYFLWAKNSQTATVGGTVTFTDVLKGTNLDLLTFVDAGSGCSYVSDTRTVTCTLDRVNPGTWGRSFRVKVADDAVDGAVIINRYTTAHGTETGSGTASFTVSNPKTAKLAGSKTAYKDASSNTAGSYTLTTEMATVSKSQIYVYSIDLKNTSETTASGIVIKDSLRDKPMSFMDTVSGCTWNATNVEITCNTSLKPNESKTFSYRVKTADGIVNGEKISNTAKVTYSGGSMDLTKEMVISTVVGCNHTCTSTAECSTGLTCDTAQNKCRQTACTAEDDCTCAVAVTKAPAVIKTLTPTKIATVAATPTILPETGILDLPGVAAFGGGLLLAVVGILLAL